MPRTVESWSHYDHAPQSLREAERALQPGESRVLRLRLSEDPEESLSRASAFRPSIRRWLEHDCSVAHLLHLARRGWVRRGGDPVWCDVCPFEYQNRPPAARAQTRSLGYNWQKYFESSHVAALMFLTYMCVQSFSRVLVNDVRDSKNAITF